MDDFFDKLISNGDILLVDLSGLSAEDQAILVSLIMSRLVAAFDHRMANHANTRHSSLFINEAAHLSA